MTKSFGMFMLLALTAGCSFHARSPNEYRDATQALLDSKSAEIKTCYDEALKGKTDLAGTVTVHFTVEAETGALSNISADVAKTQAPEVLTQCVVKSLNGLKLDPPDANPGDGTFEYQFVVGPTPPAEPAAKG
ncbi:MAG TPA: AgmX/PglI C-terminal domain-containing protein [Polyangiaceae bacterium]|nr:AgmX/PglI C-terminal domain-containing protein [Polyangiaceae bacterium]